MAVSAGTSPQVSDSMPASSGPVARPNRFWNSASTAEPGPRARGGRRRSRWPWPARPRRWPGNRPARTAELQACRGQAEGAHQHEHRRNAQRGHDGELAAWRGGRRPVDHGAPHHCSHRAGPARPGHGGCQPGPAPRRARDSGSWVARPTAPTPPPSARPPDADPTHRCARASSRPVTDRGEQRLALGLLGVPSRPCGSRAPSGSTARAADRERRPRRRQFASPAPIQAAGHHAQHRAHRGRGEGRHQAPRRRAGKGLRSAPRRPSRSQLRRNRPPRAPPSAR